MKMSQRPSCCWMAHSELGNDAAIEVKISSDMPLPMPLSVTSSPSHMTRPVPAVMVSTMMTSVGMESSGRMLVQLAPNRLPGVLGERDQRRGLQHRQTDGQVAGVLRHLRLALLALLLEGLEARDDHGQQLHDDARRDVRHDPQREDRQLQQRATAEQVGQAEHTGGRSASLMHVLHGGVAHARDGHVQPSRKMTMIAEREQQLPAQVRRLERAGESGEHRSSWWRGRLASRVGRAILATIRPRRDSATAAPRRQAVPGRAQALSGEPAAYPRSVRRRCRLRRR